MMRERHEQGFSLIEVMFALAILTVGVLGAAGVMAAGVQNLNSSAGDVIVTQKASQAIEAVFSARDSHKLTWSQIRNVQGASGNDSGIFVDGPTRLQLAGRDGLVNTGDDPSQLETMTLPGRDQLLNTADDRTVDLTAFTREIKIRDIPNEGGQLRSITVTVTYQTGPNKRSYSLVTYISAYS